MQEDPINMHGIDFKRLGISAFVAIGLALGVLGMCSKGKNKAVQEKQAAAAQLDPAAKETFNVVAYLRAHPENVQQNYNALADIVRANLPRHPEEANRFIDQGLISIANNQGYRVSPENRAKFRQIFIEDAEMTPELVNGLGPKTSAYLTEKLRREYIKKFLDGAKLLGNKAIELGKYGANELEKYMNEGKKK